MKPVSKAIIYDSSCPMCQAYTKGFVQWGVLTDKHRIAFSELQPDQARRYLDLQRSRHEIPLVDLAGGQTLYGVDALVYLLSQRLPLIALIMSNQMIYSFLKKLYSFISYNRRVITATVPGADGVNCAPDFNLKYRLAFMAFAGFTASMITWRFGVAAGYYLPQLAGLPMLLICGTGWLLQLLVAFVLLSGQRRLEYAGQLAVIMLIGTLVLLPGIAIDAATAHRHPAWLVGSVALSSTLMHAEHLRRIRYLQLSRWWVLLWSVLLFATALAWLIQFSG